MTSGRLLFVLAAAAASLAGCACWKGVDAKLLSRYQRAMAARAPQRRAAEKGLASLRPRTTGPALTVVSDPQTGKTRIELSLDEAVLRALANSLDIQVVSFDPAITREEIAQAEAEFEFLVFGAFSYSKDDKRTDSIFGGGTAKARVFSAGVRKKTITGAEAALEWTWTRSWTDLIIQTLRTRHEPTVTLEITQPLLRDGGTEVNLATLRIARLNHKVSLSKFREQVEEIITQVVRAYWQLVQARLDLRIHQALLQRTRETQEKIKKRMPLDATAVEVKQSEAAVQSRRARLIRARKVILDAQEQLGRLLADKQINVLVDCEVIPTTEPMRARVTVNAADQLMTALRRSPVLAQARLAIEIADITVRVAQNQTLPRLDLTASTGFQGLGATYHQAREQLHSGDYASYAVALSLEYPIGNRYAEAELRKSRYERLKAVTNLQNLADQIAVTVRERCRQIEATFEEVSAQRAAVGAAKAQLKALEDTERIRGRLTPAFLQTKLAAQELLANAERAELDATIQYNTALTDLAQATGTILDRHHVKMEKVIGWPGGGTGRLGPIPDQRPRQP